MGQQCYDLSKFELARKKVLALCSDKSIEKQSPAEWLSWAQKFDVWRHYPIYKDKFTQIISQLPKPKPETDDSLGDLTLSRGQQQELAIRRALIKLEIDADNLPQSEAGRGKSGLRSKVADVIDMQYFQSIESFNKAWGKFRRPRQ